MPLAAGTRLGPYEILAPLGAGGMGEVYRARDAKLAPRRGDQGASRGALPATPNVWRVSRRRRARASGLNHPNIVTIYEIGSANGTSFIAMELVEGEDAPGARRRRAR